MPPPSFAHMHPPTYPRTALVQGVDNDGLARQVVYSIMVAAEILAESEAGTEWHTGAELHAFVRDRVKYEADADPLGQRLRMPWRTVWEGVTDCKSSAIFIGGHLLAQGEPVTVRFVDVDGIGAWTHVYILGADGIALDPLLPLGHEPEAKETCDVALS